MHGRRCHWLGATGMVLLFLLAGCGNAGNSPGAAQKAPARTGSLETGSPSSSIATILANEVSTVSFKLNGGVTGVYMIQASLPTSKLRHDYLKFTMHVAGSSGQIDIAIIVES